MLTRPLDVYKTTDRGHVREAVGFIFDEVRPLLGNIKEPAKYKRCLEVVLLDLFVAFEQSAEQYVSYSRRRNDYVTGTRSHSLRLGHPQVVGVVDALAALGYVEHVDGYHNRVNPATSRPSSIRGTATLMELLTTRHVAVRDVERVHPAIVLRDGKAVEVDFAWTERLRRMAATVVSVNGLLRSSEVALSIPERERLALAHRLGYFPDTSRNTLYRVFNRSSFQLGGRFYGHWVQNIPKEYRPHLTIDGRVTTELDFGGMHIRLLYGLAGEVPPDGDVYAVDGIDTAEWKDRCKCSLRGALKTVLLVGINAATREPGVRSVMCELNRAGAKVKKADASLLLDLLCARHPVLNPYMCSDKGIELQRIDSNIAEDILLRMLRAGIVCIPLHDSFIVQAQHRDALRAAMTAAWEKFCPGVAPVIDRKY